MILPPLVDVAEIVGAINGMAGAWLIALRFKYSRWGWIAYLISNICWVAFAADIHRNWLLIQMIGFTFSSVVGVWNYWIVASYPQLPRTILQIWRRKT